MTKIGKKLAKMMKKWQNIGNLAIHNGKKPYCVLTKLIHTCKIFANTKQWYYHKLMAQTCKVNHIKPLKHKY